MPNGFFKQYVKSTLQQEMHDISLSNEDKRDFPMPNVVYQQTGEEVAEAMDETEEEPNDVQLDPQQELVDLQVPEEIDFEQDVPEETEELEFDPVDQTVEPLEGGDQNLPSAIDPAEIEEPPELPLGDQFPINIQGGNVAKVEEMEGVWNSPDAELDTWMPPLPGEEQSVEMLNPQRHRAEEAIEQIDEVPGQTITEMVEKYETEVDYDTEPKIIEDPMVAAAEAEIYPEMDLPGPVDHGMSPVSQQDVQIDANSDSVGEYKVPRKSRHGIDFEISINPHGSDEFVDRIRETVGKEIEHSQDDLDSQISSAIQEALDIRDIQRGG